MSAQIKDGGPAFPCEQHETQDGLWNQTFESGMTLRDYFAAKAMASFILGSSGKAFGDSEDGMKMCATTAYVSYAMADAMLAAREVQP